MGKTKKTKLQVAYDKLEPLKFGKLEANDFLGVLLNYDDCVLIVGELVRMESELRKLKIK